MSSKVGNSGPRKVFATSGAREALKEELRRRLAECGWREEVRVMCRDALADAQSPDALTAAVQERALAAVPSSVRTAALAQIRAFLSSHKKK